MSEIVCGAASEDLRNYIRKRSSVSDISRELYRQACKSTADHIQAFPDRFVGTLEIESRHALLAYALTLARSHDGLAMEFGVGDGETLSIIATQRMVHGFDSFQGLPEDWRLGFPKGKFSDAKHFKDELSKHPNIELYEGWFSETLPAYVKKHRLRLSQDGIAFIHIDSDLYSSARTVLEQLTPWIVSDTLILFDEFWNYPGWRNGEFKAWMEWARKDNSKVPPYKYIDYDFIAINPVGEQVLLVVK